MQAGLFTRLDESDYALLSARATEQGTTVYNLAQSILTEWCANERDPSTTETARAAKRTIDRAAADRAIQNATHGNYDYDLARRLLDEGWTLVRNPRAACKHRDTVANVNGTNFTMCVDCGVIL